MSRVDDSADERRRADVKAAEKRLIKQKAEKRSAEAAAFDRALERRAAQEPEGPARRADPQRAAAAERRATQGELERMRTEPDFEAPVFEEETTRPDEGTRDIARRAKGRADTRDARSSERPSQSTRAPGGDAIRSESDRRNVREHVEKNESRAEERLAGAPGKGRAPSGPLARSGDESGGKKGGGQGREERPDGGFKIPPPALMAPPPVARPKETTAQAQVRALAQEIVNRIVERVRVGTNERGLPEFQIELRSSVLAGLFIKVSSNKGRIRAVFSSRDGEVLKGLRLASRDLKSAMEARGLDLQDLEFESL